MSEAARTLVALVASGDSGASLGAGELDLGGAADAALVTSGDDSRGATGVASTLAW